MSKRHWSDGSREVRQWGKVLGGIVRMAEIETNRRKQLTPEERKTEDEQRALELKNNERIASKFNNGFKHFMIKTCLWFGYVGFISSPNVINFMGIGFYSLLFFTSFLIFPIYDNYMNKKRNNNE